MAQGQEQIRERVRKHAYGVSEGSLELAWDLGAINAESLWRGFLDSNGEPFKSYPDYIQHDLGGHVSRAYGYALANVGIAFRPHKERIAAIVKAGTHGMSDLTKLAASIKGGEITLERAMRHLDGQEPLPQDTPQEPLNGFSKLEILIPKELLDDVKLGLLRHAIRTGHARTLDEAFIDMAVAEAANQQFPPWVEESGNREKIVTLVNLGKFTCRYCGKIPHQPTFHHLVPRSIGQCHGPQELLCLSCHTPVQAEWAKYGSAWLGAKAFKGIVTALKEGRCEEETWPCEPCNRQMGMRL